MEDTLNCSEFVKVADAAKSKDIAVEFAENEAGFLCFQVRAEAGLTDSAMSRIFGKVLPKIRAGIKSLGYSVASSPDILDGEVYFNIQQSSFYGKLANLREGWETSEDYVSKAAELLSNNPDQRAVKDAIALLSAVEAEGSFNGIKAQGAASLREAKVFV